MISAVRYSKQVISFQKNLQKDEPARTSLNLSSLASLHTFRVLFSWLSCSQLVLAYFLDRKLEYFSIGSLFTLVAYYLPFYIFLSKFYHEDILRFKEFFTSKQI